MSAWCFSQSMDCVECWEQREPSFKVRYDKFQSETTIRFTAPVRASEGDGVLEMSATAFVPDNGGKPSILLSFSQPRQIYNQPTLRLLVNNHPMEFTSKDISQYAVFIIPIYDFDRIATGKTVDIQLSTFEGSLTKETLNAFKKLVELTKPQLR